MPPEETVRQARAYLDQALAIQRELGYVGSVPDEVYDRATSETARALRSLAEASKRPVKAKSRSAKSKPQAGLDQTPTTQADLRDSTSDPDEVYPRATNKAARAIRSFAEPSNRPVKAKSKSAKSKSAKSKSVADKLNDRATGGAIRAVRSLTEPSTRSVKAKSKGPKQK